MNKYRLKNVIKIVAFLLIFTLLFTVFYRALSPGYGMSMKQAYQLPNDTIDVLVVGSSHAYRSINPQVWYSEHGTSGYVIGTPTQAVWNSYYLAKEVLKTQHPKVIMLEAYKV
nr:hypothetical protein [Lachnospiraceae bacterium]